MIWSNSCYVEKGIVLDEHTGKHYMTCMACPVSIAAQLQHRVTSCKQALTGILAMYYFEDTKPQPRPDTGDQQRLLLDGTVYLDNVDDETPQASGLLAFLKQYLGSKTA